MPTWSLRPHTRVEPDRLHSREYTLRWYGSEDSAGVDRLNPRLRLEGDPDAARPNLGPANREPRHTDADTIRRGNTSFAAHGELGGDVGGVEPADAAIRPDPDSRPGIAAVRNALLARELGAKDRVVEHDATVGEPGQNRRARERLLARHEHGARDRSKSQGFSIRNAIAEADDHHESAIVECGPNRLALGAMPKPRRAYRALCARARLDPDLRDRSPW